jgi:hypothetical protein
MANEYRSYPEPIRTRSGCKVSWNYYDNLADAQACAEAAQFNARIDAAMGYDFGFCAPGEIRSLNDGAEFEVCLP